MKSNNSIISDYTSTDDAAAVRLDDGRILLQTVDFFTPIVDDPYLFGQISAANSLFQTSMQWEANHYLH